MSDQLTDTMAPWTIKRVPAATRKIVTRAATREGLTVGQWLERRVAEWEGKGSPVRIEAPAASTVHQADLIKRAQLLQATRALAKLTGVTVPHELTKDVITTARATLRTICGLPQPAPRKRIKAVPAPISAA